MVSFFSLVFKESGLEVNPQPFQPHITLGKMSRQSRLSRKERQQLRAQKIKRFPETSYAKHVDQRYERVIKNTTNISIILFSSLLQFYLSKLKFKNSILNSILMSTSQKRYFPDKAGLQKKLKRATFGF